MRNGQVRPNIMLTNEDFRGLSFPMARVTAVWQALKSAAEPAVWYASFDDGHFEAAATLGEGVDAYLADLAHSGKMSDCLIADRLCMLMLGRLYSLSEDGMGAAARLGYAFPEESAVIERILEHTGAGIALTPGGMMKPLKSAAYILKSGTQDADCAGICSGCGSGSCPYAMQITKTYPDAVRYSYGYQQIFRTSDLKRQK